MVPRKRASRKVQRAAKSIVVTEESIPKPTVTMTEDPYVLRELLDAAPEVPYVTTIEQAVTFVDKYSKWKARVKAAKR